MLRTRIKICGICHTDDAIAAVNAGADALGFVFYQKSPRYIELKQAQKIIKKLPAFVTAVGLFVDAEPFFIRDVIKNVAIDCLQFHGHESEAFCQQFNKPYIKALRVKADTDVAGYLRRYPSAQAILLDTYQKGVSGGTGACFNWHQIPKNKHRALILAGGLDASNVAKAIAQVSPYAVDVSGGVEKINQQGKEQKGVKDHTRMAEFATQVIAK